MKPQQFIWEETKQLSLVQILLAFALPSVFAFTGFHVVLPTLVSSGVPVLIAWPSVASAMLAIMVFIAIVFLRSEAKELNISIPARMCLKKLSAKDWLAYIAIMIIGLAIASGANQLVEPFMNLFGLEIPDYMPFFLDPSINPLEVEPEILSPGLPLKGQLILLPLFALALLLNITAEELYFRAWMLPKMAKYGQLGWVLNALLFALYHIFQIWLFPTILAGSLIWAFVIYRSKSIYPAFVGHLVGNFLLTFIGLCYLILA